MGTISNLAGRTMLYAGFGPAIGGLLVWLAMVAGAIHEHEAGLTLLAIARGIPVVLLAAYMFGVAPAAATGMLSALLVRSRWPRVAQVTATGLIGGLMAMISSLAFAKHNEPAFAGLLTFAIPGLISGALLAAAFHGKHV